MPFHHPLKPHHTFRFNVQRPIPYIYAVRCETKVCRTRFRTCAEETHVQVVHVMKPWNVFRKVVSCSPRSEQKEKTNKEKLHSPEEKALGLHARWKKPGVSCCPNDTLAQACCQGLHTTHGDTHGDTHGKTHEERMEDAMHRLCTAMVGKLTAAGKGGRKGANFFLFIFSFLKGERSGVIRYT